MPPQAGKSGLAGKLATDVDTSIQQSLKEAPKAGFIAMPGGVKQGVARLVKIGFYEYKADTKQKKANGQSAAGEYYFRAVGVATEPKDTIDPITNNRARVAGLQTSIMINCFDTSSGTGKDAKVTTQAENMVKVVDAMRLLAGDAYMKGANKYNLEQLAAGMQKVATAKPLYFAFSTSVSDQGKVNPKTGKPFPPRVFENWHGVEGLENYAPPSAVGMVSAEDLPEPPEPAGEDHAEAGDAPAEADGEAAPADEVSADSVPDLDALAARADVNPPTKDSKAAAEELKAIALKIGLDGDTVDNADNWAQVAQMISNFDPAGIAESPPAEEPEPTEQPTWTPKKGDIVQYKRPGVSAATKKPFKPFDCEVLDVSTKKSMVKLKSSVDNKTIYENVPFDLVAAK